MKYRQSRSQSPSHHIYIVIGTFYPLVGGAETQALAQGRSLRARGYQSTIVTFHHEQAWPSHDEIEGVPVLRVAGNILGQRERLPRPAQQVLYLLALLVMGWTLWQHRQRYDILHLYQLSLLTLPTALACRVTGKPLIISVRSAGSGKTSPKRETASLLPGPLDPSTPWLRVDAQTWIDGDLAGLVRMGKPVVRFAYAQAQAAHAKIILLNWRMQDYLAAHDFQLPDVQCIPNGVDTTRFYPAQYPPTGSQDPIVVCVSKLRYEKGIDVLLQAWRLVQHEIPQARLLIVGSGPLEFQLRCMAEALDIRESVEFAGLQTDVCAQLQRAHLAILPSRWEGMPNALLEAMACGLPCVATRVSGSEDIIEHGVNGLLVDSEDYKAMARALLTLLHDSELTQRYAQAALATIKLHYSLEQITKRYMELYQSLARYKQDTEGQTPSSAICHSSL